MLRPTIKIPLWAAAAIPVAAYVVRSAARGMEFAPDLPGDAIVFGALALVIAAAAIARRSRASEGSDSKGADQVDDQDRPEGNEGQ